MDRLRRLVEVAREKWDRDSGIPLRTRAKKASEYALSLALAPLYLRDVTTLGQGVRTLGKPRIDNQGQMVIGDGTLLRSVLVPLELATAPGSRLTIGKRCSLNYGVSIGCTERIEVGDRVRMGPFVMIVDSQFHDLHDRQRRPPPSPVRIANDVWIGTRSSVLPGVSIGRGAVIGAHSLVNRDVPPFTIWGGVPAKQIGQIDPKKFVCPEEPV
jgi:acetyltransferase-like isoleucine patch superfamily enzyme